MRNLADLRRRITERAAFVDAYKLARGCADCGYHDHPAALDFDHLPGTVKTYAIAEIRNRWTSPEKLATELAKCEVVCANCHRIRTSNRRKEPPLDHHLQRGVRTG